MKKLFALFLASAMALSLVACGGEKADAPVEENNNEVTEPAPEAETLHFSVILKTGSSEHWQLVEAGCKAFEAEHENVTIDVVGPPSETSYDEQQNM